MYWLVFMIWPLIDFLLNKSYNIPLDNEYDSNNKNKIIRNIISATHSIGCTSILLLVYYTNSYILKNIAVIFSSSYFLWDSYFIVIKKQRVDYAYLIHHVISLHVLEYVLWEYSNSKLVILLIIYGELSNFPHYLVYHKLKKYSKNVINTSKYGNIKLWRHIQIVWFIFFRVFVFGMYVSSLYKLVDSYFLISGSYTIYLMGLYWGFGQIKGIYKDYYKKVK